MTGKGAFENYAAAFSLLHRMTTEQPFDGYYHSHQAAELLYVHRGEGRVVVREKTYEIRPGRLFYFQPYQLHRVHADITRDSPYVRTILHFMPSMVEDRLRPFPELHRFLLHLWHNQLTEQVFDLGKNQLWLESLYRFYAETEAADESPGESSEGTALFLAQLLQTVRAMHDSLDPQRHSLPSGNARHSERIMSWIGAHYKEAFNLDELAAELHVSKYHLSRVFRAETGSSITEYLIAFRLKEACRLLRTTTVAIDVVGSEVGIGNASYFSQLFRKRMGITPHEYRKRK